LTYAEEDGSVIYDIITNLRLVNDTSHSYIDVHTDDLTNFAAVNK